MNGLLGRTNLAYSATESWRPPTFLQYDYSCRPLLAKLRRFLDLQAASIHQDLSQLLPQVRGKVVDVGCGAQPYRQLFNTTVNYQGIDHQDAVKFGYEVPDVLLYSGTHWPVESDSVDVVLATETLEHVPDPSKFLSEAERVLKSEGSLVLTVPFSARWHYIPFDYWRFTPSTLATLLTANGFESIAVYARGNGVTVASYKLLTFIYTGYGIRITGVACQVGVGFARLFCLPVAILGMLILALVGQVSLTGRGGDDCLGYTVVARKRIFAEDL